MQGAFVPFACAQGLRMTMVRRRLLLTLSNAMKNPGAGSIVEAGEIADFFRARALLAKHAQA
jgi:hypothetical protein